MSERLNLREEHAIIGQILAKYPVMTDLTQEELKIWEDWLAIAENKTLFESIIEERETDLRRFLAIQQGTQQAKEKFYTVINPVGRIPWWNKWQTYVAAASVIAIFVISLYIMNRTNDKIPGASPEKQVVKVNDAAPGKYKAKLLLDDGTVIVLDSAKNGQLAQQGGTYVINKNGQLIYQGQNKGKEILYNTLSTSKGETYATVLSDGTQVWLNSQSSIKYPVAFSGDLRTVEITGEAYFEVARVFSQASGKKIKLPFVVIAPGVNVEVLGTHFNINSYSDEDAVKATLLEGKVKVLSKSNDAIAILQPGEQAQLNRKTFEIKTASDIDTDAEVAWRYGYFQFNNADLKTVMRQLARWYDMEVIYQGQVTDFEFIGKIPRNMHLSQVLAILEKLNVHFKIEGKKLIVSP